MSLVTSAPVVTPHVSDPELDDESNVAHIVRVAPGETATAKILEARIEGTPVEALCGYTWVPNKDPRNLAVCSKCKEIYSLYRFMNENLSEDVNDG